MALPNFLQPIDLKNLPHRAWELGAELPPQDGSAWFGCFVSSLLFIVFPDSVGCKTTVRHLAVSQRKIWNICTIIMSLQCQCESHLTCHGDISTVNTSPHANRSHKCFLLVVF